MPYPFPHEVSECKRCHVNSVSLGPPNSTITQHSVDTPDSSHPDARTLNVGIEVPYSLDFDGNAQFCKCKYVDNGSILLNYTIFGITTSTNKVFNGGPSDRYEFPGNTVPTRSPDRPGLNLVIGPAASPLTYDINYNWSGTFSCTGTDGSSDSKSARILQEYTGTIQVAPGNTSNTPQR